MTGTRLRLLAICAAVGSLTGDSGHRRIHSMDVATMAPHRTSHPDDPTAALAQLDVSNASHVAARSGDWSDPGTWSSHLPVAGARVVIPRHVTVTVGAPVALAMDWVRVEGRLQFSPVENSRMLVTSMLVTPTGTLSIGTPDHPVDAGKSVQLLFTPRSATTRRQDRFDILGGLIALGHIDFYGAQKTAFATPSNLLQRGVSALNFVEPPMGWRPGDELLFPATDAASDDEQRRIASISDDRLIVALSSPLKFGHVPPQGIAADVPVANLTRNIILASTETRAVHQRGHVMVMTHEAAHISGTVFRSVGRTVAARPHTLPTVDEAGTVSAGANPIGRYAIHFHLGSGASRRNPPHTFIGNVIVDSPKHGLVNHGGHVVAEDNVTFGIHGSHFFAENGSEIGTFRHNLAVFSRGSGEHIEGRQAGIGDFGHGGHGFWSESPAVVIEHNYAFHHSGPAYVIFAAPIEPAHGGQNVFFRGGGLIANFLQDNLDPPLRAMVTVKEVPPTTIPFRFSRNTAANSNTGLEVWHTNLIATHNIQSIVEDCVFWHMRSAGIAITYGMNTVVRNSTLLGSDPIGCADASCEGSVGITSGGRTRNLTVDHVQITRFSTGIRVPLRGTTTISDSHFDNKFNILIYPTQQPGRQTVLSGNTFAVHKGSGEDYHLLPARPLFHGDLSMLFERDPLIVDDRRFSDKTLYRLDQHPTSIPFRDSGVPELDGKTARQIYREYGLAIAGALAPDDAAEIPGIGGLVGSRTSHRAEMADQEEMLLLADSLQSGTSNESYTSNYERGYGVDCCNIHRIVKGKDGDRTGWYFLTERRGNGVATRLTYIDTSPPRFALDPRIKLQIHPDDVRYGFLIQGTLYDEGAPPETVRMTFDHLKVFDGTYVDVQFEYADRAGNVLRKTYRLNVTPRAVKRGADLRYDLHGPTLLEAMRGIVGRRFASILNGLRRYRPGTTN